MEWDHTRLGGGRSQTTVDASDRQALDSELAHWRNKRAIVLNQLDVTTRQKETPMPVSTRSFLMMKPTANV